MTFLAALFAATSLWCALRGDEAVVTRRLSAAAHGSSRGRADRVRPDHHVLVFGGHPVLAAATAGCAVALVVGGRAGVVAGVMVGIGLVAWLRRLEPVETRRRREAIERALPSATEILAACLVSGASIEQAVDATADAVEGPLGVGLRRVALELRLGSDPRRAWSAAGPECGELAAVVARSLDSGAPLATALVRAAEHSRRESRSAAREAVRGVGVRAAAPLGLCFLPAFVLVGVVPVVISFAQTLGTGLR